MTRIALSLVLVSTLCGIAHADCDPSVEGPVREVGASVGQAWQRVSNDAVSGAPISRLAKTNAAVTKGALTAALDHQIALGDDLPEILVQQKTLSEAGGELTGAMDFRRETMARFPGAKVSVQTPDEFPTAGTAVTVIFTRPADYQPKHVVPHEQEWE